MNRCKCGAVLRSDLEQIKGLCRPCWSPVALPAIEEPKVALPAAERVALQTSGATPLSKQQVYRLKNPDKTRADTAARVARWRALRLNVTAREGAPRTGGGTRRCEGRRGDGEH